MTRSYWVMIAFLLVWAKMVETRALTSFELMPRVPTSLSMRRVETPTRWASATTAISTDSASLRRSSSQLGKYEPVRSLGTVTSMAPTRAPGFQWR